MKVVTVEQMQAIERETDAAGISYAQMMENAGRGVAQAIMDWLEVNGRIAVILVGPGNNGGDGLVAGRYLALAGAQVAFYLLRPRPADDPNYAQVVEMGLPVKVVEDDQNGQDLFDAVAVADVLVDALLGTGVDRPVGGKLQSLLKRCAEALEENRQRRAKKDVRPIAPADLSRYRGALPLVVAVDFPSGLNCDSGELDPVALPANLTVTLAAPKIGQFRFPGAAAVGELLVADIGSPDDLPAANDVALELAVADQVRSWLADTPLDGHKGTFGKVMIAAGSINYTGAAVLAAAGAGRAGAGLVSLAVPSAIHGLVAAQLVEPTFVLLPHDMGAINENAVPVLLEAVKGYQALLLGPGFGRDEKTAQFLGSLLGGHKKPSAKGRIGFVRAAATTEKAARENETDLPALVLDADALNLLAEMDDWPNLLPANTILTPHPGEMARLLQLERDEVQADRIGVAQKAAAEWGHVVVLKGAFTVVATPDGRTALLPFANPALATAGSGDVLAGVIVALLGTGLEPYRAAVAGAFLHGAAGQKAAAEFGQRSVLAGDLPLFLAAVLAEW